MEQDTEYKKGSIPKALREQVWRVTNGNHLDGKCYVCNYKIYFNNFEAGHIIPEVTGGETSIENLRAVCRPCNRSCATKNMDAFKALLTLKNNIPRDNLNVDDDVDLDEDEDNNTRNKIARLRLYLDCLNITRFDNESSLTLIGTVIFNECNSFELFDEYCKKTDKYDSPKCRNLWRSFKNKSYENTTIKKLIELAKEDTKLSSKFTTIILRDEQGILNDLFKEGLSIDHLAYLFYISNKGNFIYDPENNSWYEKNSFGIYKEDKKGSSVLSVVKITLSRVITNEFSKRKIAKDPIVNFGKLKEAYTSLTTRQTIVRALAPLFKVNNIYEKMDSVNPNAIGFNNGVYDLASHTFRTAKPEEYISVTTGYDYKKCDPKLREDAMKLLATIFPDKLELRYVLKLLSLGLFGGMVEESFYIWLGTGANGKGILAYLVESVLGGYYDTMDTSYLYKTNIIKSDSANPIIARKKNSRFVITTDPEGDVLFKSTDIKKWTSGDTIRTKGLYQDFFNFTPKFNFNIQVNTLPRFSDFDDVMKKRTKIIRFPNTFVENPKLPHEKPIDKLLKDKINQKLYQLEFLDILIEHYKLYISEGLILPDRFKKDTEEYTKDSDPFENWFQNKIRVTNNSTDKMKSSSLYDNFKLFVDGDTNGINTSVFKKRLISKAIPFCRINGTSHFTKIKLINNPVN